MELAASLLVADFFADWYCPLRLLGKSRQSVRLYRCAIHALEKTLRRPPLLRDLSDRGIAAALQAQPPSMRPASLNSYRRLWLALGRFAFKKGLLEESPDVPAFPEDDPETTAYTLAQVETILAVVAGLRGRLRKLPRAAFWRCLILTLYYSGLRIHATLSIRMADVSLADSTLRARAPTQKQRRTQTFLMPDDWRESVMAIAKPERELLFVRTARNRLRQAFRRILIQAGLPHGPRDLFQRVRRTFGQQVDAAGGDAQTFLDHLSRVTTIRNYLGRKPLDCTFLPRPTNGHGQQLLF